MFTTHENTLHLTSLSQTAVKQLSPSFAALPHTDHADGQYRLRRYSVVRFTQGKVIETNQHDFMQTEEFNHFQGDVVRHFEPLLPQTLASEGLRELCELFVETNLLPDGQKIEIHQMRIAAIYDETQVAPEGVHQDGFDYIALIGIDRHNIVGGEVLLYSDNHTAPFYRKVLENGEVAMLDDHRLWHNAMPIRSIDHSQEGHMDVFVLTASKEQ
ncbi:2OG-Fe dioxygenase family protein [Vibrio sp. WXL210]|uniref:2OG-Fe dioxygenase family protein n=1 Tax=Vibrio sp. WXL210 TaxID=3450709 RepID=UPI003EC71F90